MKGFRGFLVLFFILLLNSAGAQAVESQCTTFTHYVTPGSDYKGVIKFEGVDLDSQTQGMQETLNAAPGMRVNALAKWTFGTACPDCRFYVNAYGSWEPGKEIAELYSGPIGPVPSPSLESFFFRAPKKVGEYVVRVIFVLDGEYAKDFHASTIASSCREQRHIFFMDGFLNVSGDAPGVEILSPRSETGVVEESLGRVLVINASIHGNVSEVGVFIDGKNVSKELPYNWSTVNESAGIHIVAVEVAGNNTRIREEVRVELLNVSFTGKPPPITWVKEFGSGLRGAELSRNGRLIFVAAGDTLYLYDQKEGQKWWKTRKGIEKVAISSNGTALAAASDKELIYISDSGEVLWNYTLPEKINSIALTPSGKVVVAAGKSVYFLDAGGNRLWNITMEEDVASVSSPTDGSIAAAVKNRVVLISNDSALIWSYPAPGKVYSVASTGTGIVAAGAEKDVLYLLNGTLQRSLNVQEPVVSLALSADGRHVLVASGKFIRFYQDGTPLWSKETRGVVGRVFLSGDASTAVYTEGSSVVLFQRELGKKGIMDGARLDPLVIAAVAAFVVLGLILFSRRRRTVKESPPVREKKKEVQIELEPVSESLEILREGSLMVHVMNLKTKKPVIKAIVRLDGRVKETDKNGRALFEDVARGRYSVRVERKFYEPMEAEYVFRGPEEQIRLELIPILGLRDDDEARLKAALEEVKRSYGAVSHLDSCLPGYFKSIAENVVDFIEASSDIPGDVDYDYEDVVDSLVSTAETICGDLGEVILDWRNVRLYEAGGKREGGCVVEPSGDPAKVEKAVSDPGKFLEDSLPVLQRRLTLIDAEITAEIGRLTITPLSRVWKIAENLVRKAQESTGRGGKAELRAAVMLIFADYILDCVEDMLQNEEVLERLKHGIL